MKKGDWSSFLEKYTATMHRWTFFKTVFMLGAALLGLLTVLFLLLGWDALAAISITLSFVSFFVFYSLSYTVRELVLVKAMQCKAAIEPLFDLDKEEELYDCIEEYNVLAKEAKSLAFQYGSDSSGFSLKALMHRLERFFGWREFHMLEEVALLAAIDLFTRQVRVTPCDVNLHARLASAFITLEHHYLEPIQAKKLMQAPSLFMTSKQQEELQGKAKEASRLALQELEIMSTYAPDELWVQEQLAISYKELDMKDKEIAELEKLRAAHTEDPRVLVRLGTLYFQTGYPGKGLMMYGELKKIQPQLAQELLAQYGSFSPFLQCDKDVCTS